MEESPSKLAHATAILKRFAHRLLTIGENRIELFTLEAQEERERLLRNFLLALGVAFLGLLAGITLTAAIVIKMWAYYSPVLILLVFAAIYSITALFLSYLLAVNLRDRQTFASSIEQLKKDRECLEKIFE